MTPLTQALQGGGVNLHAERQPLWPDSVEVVLWWGLMELQSSGMYSGQYIQVFLLAGLRAFAEQHAELLEGHSATLCSPRLGASVAGRALLRKAAGREDAALEELAVPQIPDRVERASRVS